MQNIDITMTSIIRPRIMETTLLYFRKYLFTDEVLRLYNCRLILNIDIIGEQYKAEDQLDIAKKYFDNIIWNISETPNFCNAVVWCWNNLSSDFTFHLEDDWILNKAVDLRKLIAALSADSTVVSMRLNKERTDGKTNVYKNLLVYHDRLSLNPTLFKSSFLKDIVQYMDTTLNPEKQLRMDSGGKRGEILSTVRHGIFMGSGYDALVKDIGRDWMKKTKFHKKIGFTVYAGALHEN